MLASVKEKSEFIFSLWKPGFSYNSPWKLHQQPIYLAVTCCLPSLDNLPAVTRTLLPRVQKWWKYTCILSPHEYLGLPRGRLLLVLVTQCVLVRTSRKGHSTLQTTPGRVWNQGSNRRNEPSDLPAYDCLGQNPVSHSLQHIFTSGLLWGHAKRGRGECLGSNNTGDLRATWSYTSKKRNVQWLHVRGTCTSSNPLKMCSGAGHGDSRL